MPLSDPEVGCPCRIATFWLVPAPHFFEHGVGFGLADADPIGADVDVRVVIRPHVDLDNVDAGLFGALQETRVGIDVRIVNDEHVRLLGDQRGDGLRPGVGAEMRIADLELHVQAVSLLLHHGGPALGEIDAHRDRHEGDGLAVEILEVVGPPGIVDACRRSVCGGSRERQGQPESGRYFSHAHISSPCFKLMVARCRPAAPSVRRGD